MAAMLASPVCGGFMLVRRGEESIQVGRKHLAWRLELEQVVWCDQFRLQRRNLHTLRLAVAASTFDHPQNLDLPRLQSSRKKKPTLLPKQTRKRRLPDVFEDPTRQPPANGLLVEHLIPVAHEVMQAKAIATRGVRLLLEELPVTACRYCTETHIGAVGHNLRTCSGPQSASRRALHDWVRGNVDDVLIRRDAYHLADRLSRPIRHERRFDVERIDAVEELCIQAGVDVPEHPTKRYSQPVEPSTRRKRQDASWLGGVQFTFYTNEGSYIYTESHKHPKRIDRSRVGPNDGLDTQVDDSEGFRKVSDIVNPSVNRQQTVENELGQSDAADMQLDNLTKLQTELTEPLVDIDSEDDTETVARKTLQAWERMREGCKKLMVKYRVLACGYCSEVHVGPRGHKGKACGAFKHQWRDGQHGWQDASIDDLIPPQYVWHVRDRLGPPLENALRRYYGKAPALVELCVQAGAPVPASHAPLMRLDISIPTLEEREDVF